MNRTASRQALCRLDATRRLPLLVLTAWLLPLGAQAAPAAGGTAFGGELRPESAALIRIEQYQSRFGQASQAPAPRQAARSGLAAIGEPLITAGTLLRSAFADALDPTIGLARPALMPDPAAAGPAPSSFSQSFGITRDIDGTSAFRLMDSESRAATSSAPVLGVRIGERTLLRLQMGGMETREEDGFAGGLRFEYVP